MHPEESMKYREALKETKKRFEQEGISDADVDAWYLLEYILQNKIDKGVNRTWYLMHCEEEMESSVLEDYRKLAGKRMAHIPLQHLTGEQEFFGFSFYVNEHVLIPRQDTEILVEEALKKARDEMHVLDMCTGSGCILLSIMKNKAGITGVGADISSEALEVAKENACRLRTPAQFVQSNLFESVNGSFDMIVSNPPYIATADIGQLMPEVREHEPRLALDGMEDGLYYYKRIISQSPAYLKDGGYLLFETGYDQGAAVSKLLEEAGFEAVSVVQDLAGLDRVVMGTWRQSK
mgnify:CR=1 FL=1